jgi:hypothetical protein
MKFYQIMRYYILLVLSVFFATGLLAQTEGQKNQKVRYFNHSQAGLLIGEESEDQVRKATIPSFHTINGVHVGKHFGIGIGVGVEPLEYTAFPVYVSGYYFLTDKKNTPYFSLKGGYAFANSHKKLNNNYYYYNGEYNNRGGLLFNPEIGVRFKVSGFDLTLSGGYRFQRLESQVTPEGTPYTYKHRVDYKRVSVALGIMF